MKLTYKNIKSGELLVYFILWLTVFLMPVLLSYDSAGITWSRVHSEWIKIAPFFAVFLIHNTFLFPHLFYYENKLWYFASTILIVLAISGLWVFLSRAAHQSVLPGPRFLGPGFPSPGGNPVLRPRPLLQLISETLLISALVVGFNAALKISVKWQHEEQKKKELEKEKLQTELAFLRNQISPHFFMNTLNNIHALIDVNTEDAKESITFHLLSFQRRQQKQKTSLN